jgi:hypothetical protein
MAKSRFRQLCADRFQLQPRNRASVHTGVKHRSEPCFSSSRYIAVSAFAKYFRTIVPTELSEYRYRAGKRGVLIWKENGVSSWHRSATGSRLSSAIPLNKIANLSPPATGINRSQRFFQALSEGHQQQIAMRMTETSLMFLKIEVEEQDCEQVMGPPF